MHSVLQGQSNKSNNVLVLHVSWLRDDGLKHVEEMFFILIAVNL
jgi:hypothetical protein